MTSTSMTVNYKKNYKMAKLLITASEPKEKKSSCKVTDEFDKGEKNKLIQERSQTRSKSFHGSTDVANLSVPEPGAEATPRARALSLSMYELQLASGTAKQEDGVTSKQSKYLYPPPMPIYPMEESFPPVDFFLFEKK